MSAAAGADPVAFALSRSCLLPRKLVQTLFDACYALVRYALPGFPKRSPVLAPAWCFWRLPGASWLCGQDRRQAHGKSADKFSFHKGFWPRRVGLPGSQGASGGDL